MGKEFERIKRYENMYYASSEGYKRAKQRQQNQKVSDILLVTLFMGGIFLIISNKVLLGLICSSISLLGIVYSIRYYKNR